MGMKMKTVLMIALTLPFPALAGSFTPPEGCTATLTVQSRGCNVANYYICTADQPGDKWRADFDQEGMYYQSKIDVETQWIESYEQNPAVKQVLDPNPADPANFSELLATGMDSFDFNLSKDNGEQSNVKGFDKLTGEEVVIDGMTLKRTQFEMIETDPEGNVVRQARGFEYISADLRNFFSGTSEYFSGDEWLPTEGSPVQFSKPGDKGFGATQPIFDCDAVVSGLPQSRPAG
jgi:hypothetical protein